jgi:hypothetical protein
VIDGNQVSHKTANHTCLEGGWFGLASQEGKEYAIGF